MALPWFSHQNRTASQPASAGQQNSPPRRPQTTNKSKPTTISFLKLFFLNYAGKLC